MASGDWCIAALAGCLPFQKTRAGSRGSGVRRLGLGLVVRGKLGQTSQVLVARIEQASLNLGQGQPLGLQPLDGD